MTSRNVTSIRKKNIDPLSLCSLRIKSNYLEAADQVPHNILYVYLVIPVHIHRGAFPLKKRTIALLCVLDSSVAFYVNRVHIVPLAHIFLNAI